MVAIDTLIKYCLEQAERHRSLAEQFRGKVNQYQKEVDLFQTKKPKKVEADFLQTTLNQYQEVIKNHWSRFHIYNSLVKACQAYKERR